MPAVTANVHSLAKALDAFATQAENMKSGKTVDYRIYHGMVGGRRVKGQEAHIVRLADGVYKLSWDESTGTTVRASPSKKGDAVASPSKVVEVEERMFAAQQSLAANSELRPHPR